MKRFNKVIHIAVAIDQVAEQLRKKFNSEDINADLTVEAIIGCAVHNPHSMGMIIGAMNGWKPEMNVAIGDLVNCTVMGRRVIELSKEEGKSTLSVDLGAIGSCVVKDIDPYKTDKRVLVEWEEDEFVEKKAEIPDPLEVKTVKRQLWVDFETLEQNTSKSSLL